MYHFGVSAFFRKYAALLGEQTSEMIRLGNTLGRLKWPLILTNRFMLPGDKRWPAQRAEKRRSQSRAHRFNIYFSSGFVIRPDTERPPGNGSPTGFDQSASNTTIAEKATQIEPKPQRRVNSDLALHHQWPLPWLPLPFPLPLPFWFPLPFPFPLPP